MRAAVLLSAVLTIIFLSSFFFGKGGIAELQQARRRVHELQNDVDRLRVENQRLASEIQSLKSSTIAVEKIAREDLGMAKPGEIVYVLQDDNTAPRPPQK